MILNLLVEGNTIRSVERITGVHRDTIVRLVKAVGDNCQAYMDQKIKMVWCNHVEVDEIWTYVGKKEGRIPHAEKTSETGDQYVFVALDRETKLVPTYLVGKRDHANTYAFLQALRERTVNTFQLSSDQFGGYRHNVGAVFGKDVHYAQIKKMYYSGDGGQQGYNPATLQGVRINKKIGMPKREMICTSHVERQNLTMRMQMSRFNRLTNAFSKKLDSLKGAIAIHFWHYNFVRKHSSIGTTPAIKAGLVEGVLGWELVL
jgi:IS1 family transposase